MAAVTAKNLRRRLGLLGTMFLGAGPRNPNRHRETELQKMVEAQREAMAAEAAAEAAPDNAKLAVEAAETAAVVEEQEEEISPADRAIVEKMVAKEVAAEEKLAVKEATSEYVIQRPSAMVKGKKPKTAVRVAARAADSPAVDAITVRYHVWRKALGRGDVEEAESAYTDIRNSVDDDKVAPRWTAKQQAAFNRWTPPRRCGWGLLGSLFER